MSLEWQHVFIIVLFGQKYTYNPIGRYKVNNKFTETKSCTNFKHALISRCEFSPEAKYLFIKLTKRRNILRNVKENIMKNAEVKNLSAWIREKYRIENFRICISLTSVNNWTNIFYCHLGIHKVRTQLSIHLLCYWGYSFLKMRLRGRGVKYLAF